MSLMMASRGRASRRFQCEAGAVAAETAARSRPPGGQPRGNFRHPTPILHLITRRSRVRIPPAMQVKRRRRGLRVSPTAACAPPRPATRVRTAGPRRSPTSCSGVARESRVALADVEARSGTSPCGRNPVSSPSPRRATEGHGRSEPTRREPPELSRPRRRPRPPGRPALASPPVSYTNTFIRVAEDCPVAAGEVSGRRAQPTVAEFQHRLLSEHPYDDEEELYVRGYGWRQGPSDEDIADRYAVVGDADEGSRGAGGSRASRTRRSTRCSRSTASPATHSTSWPRCAAADRPTSCRRPISITA